MTRLGHALVRKVLSSGTLALLLLCVPLQLAAQERATPIAGHSTVFESLAGLWGNFTVWLTGGVVPSPPRPEPPPESQTDNGCAVDPHGGCGG